MAPPTDSSNNWERWRGEVTQSLRDIKDVLQTHTRQDSDKFNVLFMRVGNLETEQATLKTKAGFISAMVGAVVGGLIWGLKWLVGR